MFRFRGRIIVFIFLLAAVSFAGFFESIQQYRDNKAFAKRSLTAVAEPTGTQTKGEAYQGSLAFHTDDGQIILIPPTHVPIPIRDRFRYTDNVPVKYLPDQPDKVRFATMDQDGDPLHQMAETAVMFVLCVIGLRILLKNNRNRR